MKIAPYSFSDLNNELENFKEDITNLLNYGKYAIPIVTILPNWDAEPGETVLFFASSGGTTQYFYKNSAWVSSWSVTV